MKLKTGIAVLTANALLVLLVSQVVREEAPPEGAAPLPLVEASVTVPDTRDPVVVEGALSSNTRGWAEASGTAVVSTEKGIRAELVDAYSLAAAASPVGCHLTVSVLAAIGQVESGNLVGHGLDSEHRAVPAILGPVLDGKKFAAIEDTDDGKLDGDKRWDRAVGPMQFIPASWRVAGVDMDGDGSRDPQDVDDAAGTAMVYLCAGGRDLATEAGLRDAVLSYNHSSSYLRLVLEWKTVFDRSPLTGWSALPLLDAWALTPDIPAVLPTPTAARESRTSRPAPNAGPTTQASATSPAKQASPSGSAAAATPGTATPGTATPTTGAPATGTPATGTPSTGAPATGTPATGTPTTGTPATGTPATGTPTTSTPTTPAGTPSGPSGPSTEPAPEPEPTTEPLPTCPVDPSATPTPTETPEATATADVPGDGTAKPVECVLPIDPVTGLPIPTTELNPSTNPG